MIVDRLAFYTPVILKVHFLIHNFIRELIVVYDVCMFNMNFKCGSFVRADERRISLNFSVLKSYDKALSRRLSNTSRFHR